MCNIILIVVAASAADAAAINIKWDKNFLYVSSADLPGGPVAIHYLEAYCRSGSTDRVWQETTIPHRTELIEAAAQHVRLRCRVEPDVIVEHDIASGRDDVTFRLTATNRGKKYADVQWAQPCMRVDRFTGRKQDDYFERCFIFTERGLTMLHQTHRASKARYVPGQVYVPRGISRADVNPRPISEDVPVNGLIGAFSGDGSKILAMAFDAHQELFQGVIVCIHSDFRIGGLEPGESKSIFGKLYLVENDSKKLLARYERDFAVSRPGK